MEKMSMKKFFNNKRNMAMLSLVVALFLCIVMSLTQYFIYLKINLMGIKYDAYGSWVLVAILVIALFVFNQLFSYKGKTSLHGYGRVEYVGMLISAAIFIALGGSYLLSSINRYPFPSAVFFSWRYLILMIVLVVAKAGMGVGLRFANRVIKSSFFKMFEFISYFFSALTLINILSYSISNKYRIGIDAVFTTIAGVLILGVGIVILIDTARAIVGKDVGAKLKHRINNIVKSHPEVVSLGEMVFHDYGMGNIEGTLEVNLACENLEDVYLISKDLEEKVYLDTNVKIRLILIEKNTYSTSI